MIISRLMSHLMYEEAGVECTQTASLTYFQCSLRVLCPEKYVIPSIPTFLTVALLMNCCLRGEGGWHYLHLLTFIQSNLQLRFEFTTL